MSNVQTSFLQSVHVALAEIFHQLILLGEGRLSKIKATQKETKLKGNLAKTYTRNRFACNLPTSPLSLNSQLQYFKN